MNSLVQLRRYGLVLAMLLLCGGALRAQCLNGFTYTAPITIVNGSGTALADHQVKLTVNTATLVTAGKMRADGADMRFINGSDCCAPLSYFIESGMNSTATVVWVKVPSIPASSSRQISMAYGNPTATSLSNISDVFGVYDSFDGGTLDAAKWTSALGNGSITVGGGNLSLTTTSWATVRSVAAIGTPCVVEMNVVSATGNWPHLAQLIPGTGNGYGHCMGGATMYFGYITGGVTGYSANFGPSAATGATAGIWSTLWLATGNEQVTWPGGSMTANSTLYTLPSTVNIGIGLLNGGSGALTIDWVRVRKYANPEPTASAPGAELTLAPPSITGHPVSQTRCVGQPVTFSVSGTGGTFQWLKNGQPISGATSASYTINGVSIGDTGSYQVIVSASCAPSLTSNAARLSVNTPPAITLQPVGTIGCPGQAVTFRTAATGTGISYQWRRNGVDLPGQTGTTYSIASTATTDAASYDVVVTGICGTPAVSEAAQLRVNVPPVIMEQPRDTSVCREQSFTLRASAIGTDISYQWRKEGVNIPGATSPTLTRSAQPYDAGNYDVVITGMCQPVAVSQTVSVSVSSEALLVEQPRTQQAIIGQPVTFRVKVDGGGTVRYQWQKDGVNIPGATQSFYTIASVRLEDIGSYNAVIHGTTCEQFQTVIVSDAATLLIDAPPEIGKQPEGQTLCAGGNVLLSVGVSGTNLSYQWRKNGVAIPGARDRNYTINGVKAEDAGSYDVVISSPTTQTLTSAAAEVVVNAAASIAEHPSNAVVCAGEPVVLNVGAGGNDLSYQWYRNGAVVSGATSSSYTIAAASVSDSGSYSVRVIGGCGDTVRSQGALVVVNALPAVTTQPVQLSLAHGERAVFSVSAVGSELRYQWYKDNVAISGATSPSYEIASVAESDEGIYSVVVSGVCTPSDSSIGARLTVDGVSSVPGESGTIRGARLVVVPQPAHGLTRVTVELPAGVELSSGVGLGLYDGSGRRVLDLSASYAMSGYRSAEFDASALSSGMYVCRLEGVAGVNMLGVVMVTK